MQCKLIKVTIIAENSWNESYCCVGGTNLGLLTVWCLMGGAKHRAVAGLGLLGDS